MTGVVVLIGLALLVQGGGGLANNIFSDSDSWFVLNYVALPEPLRIGGHAAMLAVGLFLVARSKGLRWLLDD
ncbi:hypothetical protein [Saccharomonospora sp.]|uniref:hypothetical protein n=1 Tax=Saccharomonospora sp. TaxID=33913 RepID=UPI0026290DE1|nr:hypothetical protein [Saccharomonospora sp.]